MQMVYKIAQYIHISICQFDHVPKPLLKIRRSNNGLLNPTDLCSHRFYGFCLILVPGNKADCSGANKVLFLKICSGYMSCLRNRPETQRQTILAPLEIN